MTQRVPDIHIYTYFCFGKGAGSQRRQECVVFWLLPNSSSGPQQAKKVLEVSTGEGGSGVFYEPPPHVDTYKKPGDVGEI